MKEIVKVNLNNVRENAHPDISACFIRLNHCTIKVFNGMNADLFESLMKVILQYDK
ncbi:MAG: hypothetical protein LKE89_04995 [Lactobacillaceae bacterium]|jgi:hypothetical protein|nr:hypothetical protein [Lactobacillaceae bacterium]MCH4056976.1 hypothetical protein [Lactobacillaceae bacterium]MCH4057143.1 hypothetical protein [Lactobacillaceae bacterium]MCH4057271.1 hypothetical protein [Lactobacillaceae bacterium]